VTVAHARVLATTYAIVLRRIGLRDSVPRDRVDTAAVLSSRLLADPERLPCRAANPRDEGRGACRANQNERDKGTLYHQATLSPAVSSSHGHQR
jgi:hypothetical protein